MSNIAYTLHVCRELVKETIDAKALTMQSTVTKYKADLATAENTMSDLHNKVSYVRYVHMLTFKSGLMFFLCLNRTAKPTVTFAMVTFKSRIYGLF